MGMRLYYGNMMKGAVERVLFHIIGFEILFLMILFASH
ncbi:hypothetical protein LEP1GSC040_0619 [Leptospira santarosai str. 2000030832]|uniref:Uncharacterized protein n=1 Tax=Leptospira santarosai serovar Arenal str. MAVJ 401 TaxID=1049976 RepID=M6JZT1_9LEPT|nr:hypothetical protein LEP1GSC040_0619 [Leptospira santarosai str. 2000030832]EMN20093.1 hypothetical protein LEP1GSC063_0723 [Leptospira santarosai serovar Arenal str. MAVJ 401]EMN20992.1 hypothetical protein LEP1GSC063_0245 [Leptospira santarosai serovar Arenal str. MAVJ 401]